MPLETAPFDAAPFITDPESQAYLLTDAFETGDPGYITHAIGIIARARGMSQVAEKAGISRSGLYKALGEGGDPRLTTLVSVMKALGVKLVAQTA